ncbi:MAG: peptide chain release factor N(5)-glutamine methyltransferase, partial [Anaerolineae bacterium]
MTTRLAALTARLNPHSETPALDAQVLLAHVTGKPRAWVLAHPDVPLTPEQERALKAALSRIERGEPLPYVLGHWEFYGLDFLVTPDVLIPRPETELLVEHAIEWLTAHPERRLAADVGTGSGCIAIALAVHVPDLSVIATDISAAALEVARRNARRLDVGERIRFICCDLLPEPSEPLDLLCANLPYIPSATLRDLDVYRREPTLALDGGPDGLDLIRRLLTIAPRYLSPGGLILLEIEASQGVQALALAYDAFE